MDWSEKNSCIKCDDGGSLLVCSEDGCPIAVHERCLGFPTKFDDSGRFYCPYCLYRQAVAESRKAREYALARKKALLVFMEEKVIDGEKHVGGSVVREENGHNQSKASEANGNIGLSDNGKSQSNDHGISDQPFQHDGGINDSAGSEGEDPSLEILGEKGNRIEEENHAREEDHESDAVEEEEEIQEEEHETNAAAAEEEDEEEIEEETSETSSASKEEEEEIHARATRGSKRREQMDKDSDDDSQRSKRLNQHAKKKLTSTTVNPTRRSSRKSSSSMRAEKVGSPRRLPPIKLASDAFGSGKRKRLFWTEEEEEELRAGVEKHAVGSTNLPWKKILNDSSKFHPTRTPSDLKDKWRKMSRKRDRTMYGQLP